MRLRKLWSLAGGTARDVGAALVEFAVLMPLLLMLVLGIVEFGYGLAQHLDVRHGAREASRLVAVDYGSSQAITDAVCDRMDLSSGQTVLFAGAGALWQMRIPQPSV